MDEVLNREMRKGFLKLMILGIVKHEPSHGYDIIHKIEIHTCGRWTPSPGSVYPALDFLQNKGYITVADEDRKKVYTITPKGEETLAQIQAKRKELLEDMMMFFGDLSEEKND